MLAKSIAPHKLLKLLHCTIQIGRLEAHEFCSSSQPQLFRLSMANADHADYFHEHAVICAEKNNTNALFTHIVATTTNTAYLLEQQQQQQQQHDDWS